MVRDEAGSAFTAVFEARRLSGDRYAWKLKLLS